MKISFTESGLFCYCLFVSIVRALQSALFLELFSHLPVLIISIINILKRVIVHLPFLISFLKSLLVELSEITGFSYVWLKFYQSYVGLWGHIVLSRSSQHTLIYPACQLKWCSTFLLQNIAMPRVSWMRMTEDCFLQATFPSSVAYLPEVREFVPKSF